MVSLTGSTRGRRGVECRILGPLEVTTTAGPLEIRGDRRRALVAFLLVNSGSAVTIDDIVDAVWADDGDLASRQHTIQNYVSQLRKLFADDDATIATVSGGYRLEIPRAALDANRFEDLRHAAAAATDAVRRRDLLAQALDCWHGRALGEFDDCIWAQSAATALENRRLEVLEQRIDVDLALGRAADLVSELETLVRRYPLRERFWAQRMLALYRSGRQAEALRTCTELRTLLADELGIEPSAEIVELELRILDQDPSAVRRDRRRFRRRDGDDVSTPRRHRHLRHDRHRGVDRTVGRTRRRHGRSGADARDRHRIGRLRAQRADAQAPRRR